MEGVWLLWLALAAAVLAIVAAFVIAGQFNKVPWIAVALGFFFIYLLVNSGALDVNA